MISCGSIVWVAVDIEASWWVTVHVQPRSGSAGPASAGLLTAMLIWVAHWFAVTQTAIWLRFASESLVRMC